jgi:hypothetical protein
MTISPSLLLLLLVVLVFAPSLEEWVTQGGNLWYRPYQLWFIAITLTWWSVRLHQHRQRKLKDSHDAGNDINEL